MNKIPEDEQRHEERRPQENQKSSLSDRSFEDIKALYHHKKRRFKQSSIPSFYDSTAKHEAIGRAYLSHLDKKKNKSLGERKDYFTLKQLYR